MQAPYRMASLGSPCSTPLANQRIERVALSRPGRRPVTETARVAHRPNALRSSEPLAPPGGSTSRDIARARPPFRDPWPRDEIITHIHAGAGERFDPELVRSFASMIATLEGEQAGRERDETENGQRNGGSEPHRPDHL